ncbi:hypothetical protein CR513_12991, partial [Mucuna pruriens]
MCKVSIGSQAFVVGRTLGESLPNLKGKLFNAPCWHSQTFTSLLSWSVPNLIIQPITKSSTLLFGPCKCGNIICCLMNSSSIAITSRLNT